MTMGDPSRRGEREVASADFSMLDRYLQYAVQRQSLDQFDVGEIAPFTYLQLHDSALRDPRRYGGFYSVQEAGAPGDEISTGPTAFARLLSSFSSGDFSFVYLIRNRPGQGVDLSIGYVPRPGLEDAKRSGDMGQTLESALFRPGLAIDRAPALAPLGKAELGELLEELPHCATVMGLPADALAPGGDELPPRIEELVDTLIESEFALMGILEPVGLLESEDLIDRCLAIQSVAASLKKWTMTHGTSDSYTLTRSETDTQSRQNTYGQTSGVTSGYGFGLGPAGAAAGAAIGLVGGPPGALIGALIGGALFGGFNVTRQAQSGSSEQVSFGHSRSVAQGLSSSTGETQSRTQDIFDKSAERLERIVGDLVQRLEASKGDGLWYTGVYVLTADPGTLQVAGTVLRGHSAGAGSHLEPLRVLHLGNLSARGDRPSLREALLHLRIPRVAHAGHPLGPLYEGVGTPLLSREVASLFHLPQRDIPGVRVAPLTHFAALAPAKISGTAISLGHSIHGARPRARAAVLATEHLRRHVFVTGMTGFGKTTTCRSILEGVAQEEPKCRFLVVEPAKRDYRELWGRPGIEKLRIYTVGEENRRRRLIRFRLNPFEPVRFQVGRDRWCMGPLQAHIDRVRSAFFSILPMHVAMPQLIAESMTRTFRSYGWNLQHSTNRHVNVNTDVDISRFVPTLGDVRTMVERVVKEKGFDARLEADYVGALRTRLDGLCDGGKGALLNTRQSIPMTELLGDHSVIELEALPDSSEKALLMALVLGNLYEYRRLETENSLTEAHLRHITLIEEAHHLLGATHAAPSEEHDTAKQKVAEDFAHILSEIRAYGEGLIIVDQIPTKVLSDVVKNTETKIVHRVVEEGERTYIGGSMGLNKAQTQELGFLECGEAIVLDRSRHAAEKILITREERPRFDRQRYRDQWSHQDPVTRWNESRLQDTVEARGSVDPRLLDGARDFWESVDSTAIMKSAGPGRLLLRALSGTLTKDALITLAREHDHDTVYALGLEDAGVQGRVLGWSIIATVALERQLLSQAGPQHVRDMAKLLETVQNIAINTLWDRPQAKGAVQAGKDLKENPVLQPRRDGHPGLGYPGCVGCPAPCHFGIAVPRLVDDRDVQSTFLLGQARGILPDELRNYAQQSLTRALGARSWDSLKGPHQEPHILDAMTHCFLSAMGARSLDFAREMHLLEPMEPTND